MQYLYSYAKFDALSESELKISTGHREKKYGRFKREKRENFRKTIFFRFFFTMIPQRYQLFTMIKGDHGTRTLRGIFFRKIHLTRFFKMAARMKTFYKNLNLLFS